MSAAAQHASPDTLSPQQGGRPNRTRGGELQPQSSVSDEEAIRIAQSMVDIAAKQLYGLREFRTSEELIQKEICESESKLVRLFSKLLAVKARHPISSLPNELKSLPRVDQWLRIVGIADSVAQILADRLSLQSMIDMPVRDLRQLMSQCGATDSDIDRLCTALGKLKTATDLQMNGLKGGDFGDLFWSTPALSSATPPLHPKSTSSSPYAGNSPKFPTHIHPHHHTLPRPSTSSLPSEAILGVGEPESLDGTRSVRVPGSAGGDEGLGDFGASSDSSESPFTPSPGPPDRRIRRLTPPPTPPVIKSGTGTIGRSGKFPTTPPPQKKNTTRIKLHPDPFQPLIKSKSHDSQLANKVNQSDVTADVIKCMKKKPKNLTLGSSEAIMQRKRSTGTLEEGGGSAGLSVRGASLSGQSSPLLNSSPFRSPQYKTAAEQHAAAAAAAAGDTAVSYVSQLSVPISPIPGGAPRTMLHYIQHRFQSKIVMSVCDLCRKHIFRGKVCKCCKAKFHKDCATKAAPSCGLSEQFVDFIIKGLSGEEVASGSLLVSQSDLLSTNHSSPSASGSPSHSTSAKQRRRYPTAFYPGGSAPYYGPSSGGGGDYSSSATSSCNSSTPSSPAIAVGSVSSSNSSSAQAVTMPSSPATFHQQQRSRLRSGAERFQFPDTAATDVTSNHTDSGYTVSSGFTMPTVSVQPVDVVNTNTSNDSDKSDRTLIDSGSADFSVSMDGSSQLERLDSQDGTEDSGVKDLQRANSISVTLKEWDIPFNELHRDGEIGTGRFGTVFKGCWHGDVAIKLLTLEEGPDYEPQLQAFKQEVSMLRKTRHENLVLFMGACMTPPDLAIITSFCKGITLFTQLHVKREKLPMNRTVIIATQIAQGMGYLHAKGIIHKDLKTKNIFLENGKVIITDFGLFSLTKFCHGTRKGRCLTIPQGWLCYLAPEIMRALRAGHQHDLDLPFTAASDVYAFGTVWYELLCGEWPFLKQPPESIIWQVGKGMKQSLTNVQASRDVKDVLMQCWAYKTSDRLDFRELLKVLDRLPKKRLARSPSHPIQLSRSAESVF